MLKTFVKFIIFHLSARLNKCERDKPHLNLQVLTFVLTLKQR